MSRSRSRLSTRRQRTASLGLLLLLTACSGSPASGTALVAETSADDTSADDTSAESTPSSTGPSTASSPSSSADASSGGGAAVADGLDLGSTRLEIVETDTGKVVQSFEMNADSVKVVGWSPDSTTVLAGASTPAGTHIPAVYRVDGTSELLKSATLNPPLWIRGASGTTVADLATLSGDNVQRLVTSKGVPVLLDWTGRSDSPQRRGWGAYDSASKRIVPFAGVFGTTDAGVTACGRFAVVGLVSGPGALVTYGLYDSDSGKITPMAFKQAGTACPIASNGGSLVGYTSTDGVRVVDLATGKQTTVAREGHPIAWSKDDSTLLVAGNGDFVVRADGSGGRQASVQLQEYCTAGDTGTLITRDASDQSSGGAVALLRYDIATDTSTSIGKGRLVQGSSCEVNGDNTWLVAGQTIIDLGSGHASVVSVKDANNASLNLALHLRGPALITPVNRKPS